MFLRLLLLFTILPVIELFLLIRVGNVIGAGTTILIVLGTGVLGAWLARREGLRALNRVQTELNAGHLPANALVDGLLILIAGLVLLTPGFLTDTMGFLLLLPPTRALVRHMLMDAFRKAVNRGNAEIITVQGWKEP